MQEICPVCGSKELKNIDTNKYKCLACDEVFNLQGVSAQELIAKDIYNQNIDSIVEVSCVFGDEDSSGTGFYISNKGFLITNAHVVVNNDGKELKLCENAYVCKSKSTEYFEAEIIYLDAKKDLALLKVNNKLNFKPVKIEKDVEVGDKVIVIGNSEGQGLLLLDGLVGDVNRKYKEADAFIYNSFVANGCSGGPIFNIKGELCGVVAASSRKTQGLNYGITIKSLKEFIIKAIKDKNLEL